MGKGSRTGRKQRSSHRPVIEAEESTPSGNLAAALSSAVDDTPGQTPESPESGGPRADQDDPVFEDLDGARVHSSRPHLEDDFFARGEEISSVPPSSIDPPELDRDARRSIPAELLERRARLRRIVTWVVGASAVLTAIGGARAFFGRSSSVHAEETSLSVSNRVVPSIALAGPSEPIVTEPAPAPSAPTEPARAAPEPAAAAPSPSRAARAGQRLPVVDVEIPAPPDPATDRVWETAAQSLTAQDFGAADRAFAELGRRPDPATRETARLARAVWWIANGKHAEVRTVLADLAANATTPSVQQQARQLLLSN